MVMRREKQTADNQEPRISVLRLCIFFILGSSVCPYKLASFLKSSKFEIFSFRMIALYNDEQTTLVVISHHTAIKSLFSHKYMFSKCSNLYLSPSQSNIFFCLSLHKYGGLQGVLPMSEILSRYVYYLQIFPSFCWWW